jgi:hypothetical protein
MLEFGKKKGKRFFFRKKKKKKSMEKTLEMTKKYCRSRLVAADGG